MNTKTHLKKFLCPLLAFFLILTTSLKVSASALPAGWPEAPEIADETGILMEADTGQILFDKGMDEVRYPASTTKVMTALLILEHTDNLNEKVVFTDVITPDLAPGNSTINAKVGEELTVEQCLYAILLASANEVCTQMAVQVAGSVDNFTAMMNERARELGCQNTNFVNANGLPDPNHYTTAHDLALILKEAVKNEAFCKVAGAAKYTIPPTNMTTTSRNLENHNALLTDGEYSYEGAIAGKTGHTEAARNTLVTAATRDDMTLICVVMRSEGDDRFTDTAKLFDYGFDNFHKEALYWLSQEESVGSVILPDNVTANCLTILDQDTEQTRTRTYFYRGTELFSASLELPVQTETQTTWDMELLKIGTQKTNGSSPLVFPVMMTVLAGLLAAWIYLIVKTLLKKKRNTRTP